jgi:hypothetical protein
MRLILIIPIFIFLSIVSSCDSAPQINDAEIERKAKNIVSAFDTISINLFVDWEFFYRGQSTTVWYRNKGDEEIYRCVYFKEDDFIKLLVINVEEFLQEFSMSVVFDSSIDRIVITESPDDFLSIIGIDSQGKDHLIRNEVLKDSIFLEDDPMLKFEDIFGLVESLQIFESDYIERIGGIIIFTISPQHELIYVPDIELLKPSVKDIWLKNFSKGKWIDEKWNLRKLEKPTALD